jgi:hypothetical protein
LVQRSTQWLGTWIWLGWTRGTTNLSGYRHHCGSVVWLLCNYNHVRVWRGCFYVGFGNLRITVT